MTSQNYVKGWIRGTTAPFRLQLLSSGTGFTFRMVVDRRPEPDDDSTELMDMVGVLDTDDDTIVEFFPSALEAAADPGDAYFQVERTRVSDGQVSFVSDGVVDIVQSLPK